MSKINFYDYVIYIRGIILFYTTEMPVNTNYKSNIFDS